VFSFHRHTRSAARAVSLLVASTAFGVAGAQAAEPAHMPLVLTAYSNAVGGASLMEKKYDEALVEIRRYKPQSSLASNAQANNLCVALTGKRQLVEAKVACTAALSMAKAEKLSSARFTGGLSDNSEIAVAYSNRAVVYALSQDMASAQADLERAQALAPKAEFVSRNLAAAAFSRSTIAQLDVSTR
jgi:tetratricopeptide (TPR) repeat protein